MIWSYLKPTLPQWDLQEAKKTWPICEQMVGELTLNWNDNINDVAGSTLNYNIGISISDSYSTITKYDYPTGYLGDYYEGQRLGDIWGYVTEGFIKDDAEAEAMKVRQKEISGTWLPGDIKYADLNGDGVITYGKNQLNDHGDKKIIGNQTPRYRSISI